MPINGHPNIQSESDKIILTNDQMDEMRKCINSYEYFMHTYLKIDLNESDLLFVKSINENRYNIIASKSKTNNTMLLHTHLLWNLLYKQQDKVCVILTPSLKQSKAYRDRIVKYYESLPIWLQCPIINCNKHVFLMQNYNRIIFTKCDACSIKGMTTNQLYIHGASFISNDLLDDFIASIFPIMSHGISSRIVIESYPYLHSRFDDIWNNPDSMFIKHGKREYVYPCPEGVENGI
jgi:hypothetical protein